MYDYVDYDEEIPQGMEIIELETCKYMIFQGQPSFHYNEEENMGKAIAHVQRAIKL